MPRPALPANERSKTRGVSLKPKCWAFVDKQAHTASISVSGYIQQLVLEKIRATKEQSKNRTK